ncbi:MAG: carbohydrate ABC transporter permease [Kineosporiaceae bacterium]
MTSTPGGIAVPVDDPDRRPGRPGRPTAPPRDTAAGRARRRLTSPTASVVAVLIAVLWTIPTIGLFLNSIRPETDVLTTGWWTIFTNPSFTLSNFEEVLFGRQDLAGVFVSTFVITIPSVLFPLLFAALAAYALAWMDFPGRDWLFIFVFALQIVPLQVALVPLLRFFNLGEIAGIEVFPGGFGIEDEWTAIRVWFAHTAFALPLAIFLLHNFMSELPRSLFEAARVDGASHARIFRSLVLPLITPALAAFAIFQFLWVWNDLLVALVFADPDIAPLTRRISELAGTRGETDHLLPAGAFITILVPLIVFLSLQRYFVRGLLAGGLKG